MNLAFKGNQPLPWYQHNKPMGPDKWAFADREIRRLWERRVVRKVEVKPRGISALKVAPKKRAKKYQLCINMHWIGGYICVPKFKFKTLDMTDLVLESGDFLFSLDDVAGYHHWSIREPFRTFFGFEWEGEWYEWCVWSGFSPMDFHKREEGVSEDVEGEGSEANPLHG